MRLATLKLLVLRSRISNYALKPFFFNQLYPDIRAIDDGDGMVGLNKHVWDREYDKFVIPLNAENQPLFYDNVETSGSGTSTSYNPNKSEQVLTVADSTAGVRDEFIVVVRPVGGSTNVSAECSITWGELI